SRCCLLLVFVLCFFSFVFFFFFFFSSRRRHTRFSRDWSSDVCSSDLQILRLPSLNILQSHGIITDYFYFLLQFAKILDDVISKRVIVVDHEKHFEHNLLKFMCFIALRYFVTRLVTRFEFGLLDLSNKKACYEQAIVSDSFFGFSTISLTSLAYQKTSFRVSLCG